MKTNKKFINDIHAQAGIGTLIIFIAMVLVAAVAAAVLISTQGLLQQKAAKTGTETLAEVSTNLKVLSIVGDRGSTTAQSFTYVNFTIESAAGAGKIDLSQIKMMISNGSARIDNITYASSGDATNTTFTASAYRDADSSFSATNPVITSGDLVMIVTKPGATVAFAPRAKFQFEIIPEVGRHLVLEGTSPSTYGIDRYITLE